jgi:hypothetical protein
MGVLWIFLGIGAVIAGVAAFEGGVMKSPKAGVSIFRVIGEMIDTALGALFRIF